MLGLDWRKPITSALTLGILASFIGGLPLYWWGLSGALAPLYGFAGGVTLALAAINAQALVATLVLFVLQICAILVTWVIVGKTLTPVWVTLEVGDFCFISFYCLLMCIHAWFLPRIEAKRNAGSP